MRRDPGKQREAPNRLRAALHQRLAPWRRVVVLSCAAAAALLAGYSNAGPASSGTGAALEASATEKSDAALAEAIRSAMQRASIPGAIVGVWREGQPPYVRRSASATWRAASRWPRTSRCASAATPRRSWSLPS